MFLRHFLFILNGRLRIPLKSRVKQRGMVLQIFKSFKKYLFSEQDSMAGQKDAMPVKNENINQARINIDYTYNPFTCFARKKYLNPYKPKSQVYENAVILPIKFREGSSWFQGGVVDADGQYVEASSLPPDEVIFADYQYDVVKNCDADVVYIGGFWRHWGHFIIELTSRLWYVLEHDKTHALKLAYTYIYNEPLPQFYLEIFHLLGIKDEQLMPVKEPTCFKSVVVPEISTVQAGWYTQEFKNIYDKVMKSITPVYHDKIYFSRTRLKKAIDSEFGEPLLEHIFAQNGYTIIYPETLPVSEQLALIKGCRHFAMVSGTLCHNMLFAQEGSEVIILEKTRLRNGGQRVVNQLKNLQIVYVDCYLDMPYIALGCGPFLLVPNDNFVLFWQDRGFQVDYDEKQVRKDIESYVAKYREYAKLGKLKNKKLTEAETEEVISQFKKHVFDGDKLNLMADNSVEIRKYFDEKYYQEHYPEVKTSGMSAVEHFMYEGWKKGYNPSQNFDTNFYLTKYKDVARAGINPLQHYIQFGIKEGRKPTADSFSADEYRLIAKSKYFDEKWYLQTYPDVKQSGQNPVEHYMRYGWKEGRNPGADFNTNVYLEINADVKRAGINPLLHYEKYGRKEERKISR